MSDARKAPGTGPDTPAQESRGAGEPMPSGERKGTEAPFDPADPPEDMPADPTTLAGPEEGLPEDTLNESLTGQLAALIDDTRTYAEAELNFQKTRASLAGKNAGIALGLVVVAVVVLHVAVLALAVGLVMALAPLVTIWGAIALVVGALIVAAGLLGWQAARRGQRIAAIFASPEPHSEIPPGDETAAGEAN